MKILLSIIIILISLTSYSQEELAVPSEIKNEIELKVIKYHDVTYKYKVKYPKNYSENKTYKVYLALSGGNQFEKIVDYCYYAWFRSSFFDKYITIMPINTEEESLKDYGNEEILEFYDMLMDNEKVTKHGWIIGGTSNGGMAAFNFLKAYPDFFEGAILMPGAYPNHAKVPHDWAHLKFVLAYGDKDIGWDHMTQDTYKHLKKEVKDVTMYVMKGQEHVVIPEYNIDQVYKIYFGK